MLGDGKSLRRHLNMYRDMSDAKVNAFQRIMQGSPTRDGMSRGDGVGEEGSSEGRVPGGASGNLDASARSKQRNNLKK